MARKTSSSFRRRTTRRRKSSNRSGTTASRRRRRRSSSSSSSSSSRLSARTRKAIDTLPSHAQHIYKKAHKNALKQYKSPSKRRGGTHQSREQVAHKVAWSAVKREYKKKGDRWVPKD
jgi:cation transport regulator